jgi:hypothetical protein
MILWVYGSLKTLIIRENEKPSSVIKAEESVKKRGTKNSISKTTIEGMGMVR